MDSTVFGRGLSETAKVAVALPAEGAKELAQLACGF
jgi:hypothetical protein